MAQQNATIDINLVTKIKEDVSQLQNKSKKLTKQMPPDKAAALEKNFLDLNQLLSKGTKINKNDIRSINSLIKTITDTLFNVASKSVQWSKPLLEANKQFQKLTDQIKALQEQTKAIKGRKINVSEKTGQLSLTTAEADRLTKEMQVPSTRRKGNIASYSTLVNEASLTGDKANPAAAEAVAKIQAKEAEYIATYIKANDQLKGLTQNLDELNKKIKEIAKTEGGQTKEAIGYAQAGANIQQQVGLLGEQVDQQDDTSRQETIADIQELNTSLEKQQTTLGKAFKQFTIYAIVIRTVKKALREAVQTVQQLDRSLTEQAMVTGKTRQETYKLLSSYQQLAIQLGSTSKDVAEVATQFMRQGKTAQDSLKLTEAAVSAAKVAGISATESVNYLTTALNGFRLSADQAMRVSDRFASIAAVSATSYEELATALSKVAAQANLAGMSIDYTTALLAKGIETTREAPETIGTALKTIIARMRELTDYGQTLDDSMDINNVETQLAYVGIALRDTNGELRSTEDVLNDLGAKWDTLNSNQQAAVAKALAGTRQQSRLIAMMTDYERVLELQEVAAQSAGATSAQMATYMEGMDAALNKVNVGWEKLVSGITNSDAIISLVNTAASVINTIAENLWVLVPVVVTITTQAFLTLTHKMRELEISQLLQDQEQQRALLEAQQQEEQAKQLVTSLKQQKTNLTNNVLTQQKLVKEKQITLEDLKQSKSSKKEIKAAEQELLQAEAELKVLESKTAIEEKSLDAQIANAELNQETAEKYNNLVKAQAAGLSGLKAQWAGLGSTIGNVFLHAIPGLKQLIDATKAASAAKKVDTAVTKEQGVAETTTAQAEAGGSAAKIPYVGWIIWAIIMGVGVVSAVFTAIKSFQGLIKSTGDKINESSAKMFNLRKEMSAIETATDSFDTLDNKLIKTNKDLEEMNTLMSEVGDKLSSDEVGKNKDIGFGKGVSARQYYEQFTGDVTAQRKALDKIQEVEQSRQNDLRREQLELIRKNRNLLTDNSADGLKAQMAVLGLANESAYSEINKFKDKLGISGVSNLRQVTENLISELSSEDQYALAENTDKMTNLVNRLASVQIQINGAQLQAASLLNSADATLTEQVQAYSAILSSLEGAERAAFESYYTQFNGLIDLASANQEVLNYIDESKLTIDKINEFYAQREKLAKAGLQYTEDQWHSMFVEQIMPSLAETNGDIAAVIDSVFSTQLSALDESLDAYNAIVKAFGDLVEVGILNMGQNLESLYKSINNLYTTASEWGGMSESDRTQFILDNADLFSGESGAELLQAFETSNYNLIEQALRNNESLNKRLQTRLAEIEQELLVETAYQGDKRNEAYIKYLEQQRDRLRDNVNIFRADLKVLIDQQNAQLELYKDYLEQQQEELEDALDKRKEAYQKYFDALKEIQEDEDYEEQATRLATNAAKLASSTDAHSNAVRADLEQQLQDLEKEHLQQLRERAQEAVLNSLDDEVEHISNALDELLKNSELLYQMMQNELSAGGQSFLNNLITSRAATGEFTALGMENWITNTLGPAFASSLSGIDYNSLIGLGNSQVNYNTSLNINQIAQNMTDDQKSLVANTLMNLLRNMGFMN